MCTSCWCYNVPPLPQSKQVESLEPAQEPDAWMTLRNSQWLAPFSTFIRCDTTWHVRVHVSKRLNSTVDTHTLFAHTSVLQTGTNREFTNSWKVGLIVKQFWCLCILWTKRMNVISTGKPYRLGQQQLSRPDWMERIFRQACTWSSFTLNRDDTAWRYYTFIRKVSLLNVSFRYCALLVHGGLWHDALSINRVDTVFIRISYFNLSA